MKLRNKKTGEIKEVIVGGYPVSGKTKMWECSEMDANEETGYKSLGTYYSLAELNKEWEDYEEPKEHWFIDFNGEIKEFEVLGFEWQGWMKEIGNYFKTREEAEKAVEKLKAWKRLKEARFNFTGYKDNTNPKGNSYQIIIEAIFDGASFDDLDLLFGGEE